MGMVWGHYTTNKRTAIRHALALQSYVYGRIMVNAYACRAATTNMCLRAAAWQLAWGCECLVIVHHDVVCHMMGGDVMHVAHRH